MTEEAIQAEPGADAAAELLNTLEELSAIIGVKGALIAQNSGAFAEGLHSGLEAGAAQDVAKTVRRMVVASSSVGVPLEELLMDFGAALMMIVPLREDAILVVLLERDTATAPVRSLLDLERKRLDELLVAHARAQKARGLPDDSNMGL